MSLLRERENERVRAYSGIACASGMRASEICRIKLADVDLGAERIAVRLANKGRKERRAFSDGIAKQTIIEWLGVRNCDHTS